MWSATSAAPTQVHPRRWRWAPRQCLMLISLLNIRGVMSIEKVCKPYYIRNQKITFRHKNPTVLLDNSISMKLLLHSLFVVKCRVQWKFQLNRALDASQIFIFNVMSSMGITKLSISEANYWTLCGCHWSGGLSLPCGKRNSLDEMGKQAMIVQ